MYDSNHFDVGHVIAAIVITVIAMAGLFSLANGASAVDAREYQAEEQLINELRVKRI